MVGAVSWRCTGAADPASRASLDEGTLLASLIGSSESIAGPGREVFCAAGVIRGLQAPSLVLKGCDIVSNSVILGDMSQRET